MTGILFILIAFATGLAFLRWCEIGLDLFFNEIREIDKRIDP